MNLALKVIPPVQLVISSGLMYVVAINLPQYSFDFTKKIIMILALITVAGLLGVLALYDFHKHQTTFHPHIPVPLEDARFRKSERFIVKAHFFINGCSLKKKCNAGYDLLSLPQGLV